jgi:hypothetical protein
MALNCVGTYEDSKIGFQASGRVTLDLGSVKLPGVGPNGSDALIPNGTTSDINASVSVVVEHRPGAADTTFSISVAFTLFGWHFSFDHTFDDGGFLEDLAGAVKRIIEDASYVGKVFAWLLDNPVTKWIASALGGFLLNIAKDYAKYLAAAMNALAAGVREAAALMHAVGVTIDLAKAAIHAIYSGDWSELEAEIDKVFGLQLDALVLAQRIGPLSPPVDYKALVEWVAGSDPSDLPALVKAGDWSKLYQRDAQWLALLEMHFLAVLEIGVAFYDPSLAGLKLATSSPLPVIELDVSYRRVSPELGVYEAQLTLPASWGPQNFGPVKITPPVIDLSIYTNGDFVLDAGFPFGGDWSKAAKLDLGVLSGAGGFYFGALPGAVDSTWGKQWQSLNPVLEAGVALDLHYDRSLDFAIFSGGVSARFTGIVQGAVGFQSASGNFLGTPAEIALRGQLALAASIYGSVDFGIVKGSANISLSMSIGVGLVSGQALDLSFEASVSVSVKVRIHLFIATITIGFSFSAKVHVAIVVDLHESAPRMVQAPREPVALIAPTELRALGRRLSAGVNAAGRLNAPPALEIWFTPEATVVYEGGSASAYGLAGLSLGLDAFQSLAAAAATWVLASASETFAATGEIALAELDAVRARLRAARLHPARYLGAAPGDAASTYAHIASLLATSFTVTVVDAPSSGENTGVPFPMPPDLVLSAKGRANPGTEQWPREFRSFNLRGPDWQQAVEAWFSELDVLKVLPGAPTAEPLASGPELPVCEYLFVDWFQMLHEGALHAVSQQVADEIVTSTQLTATDFTELAGQMTQFVRNGVQLPVEPTGTKTAPLYELTGQQFQLLAQSGVAYELSLAAVAGVSWLSVAAKPVPLDTGVLKELLGAPAPASLPNDPTLSAFYRSQPARWAFGTLRPWTDTAGKLYALAPFPPTLLGALAGAKGGMLEVSLTQQDTVARTPPTPLSAAGAQALALTLQVRKIAGSEDVYELWAIDQSALAALDALIAAGASAGTLSGTLLPTVSGALVAASAAGADVVFLRTNLTTEIAPPHDSVSPFTLTAEEELDDQPSVAADLTHLAGVLEILQWYGRANASGYYLQYKGGLPAGAFASTDTAEVVLLVQAPLAQTGTPPTTKLTSSFNALVLGPLGSSLGSLLYAATAAGGNPALDLVPTVPAGVLPLSTSRKASSVEDPLGSLYSLVTFAIAPNVAFRGSVTAVPSTPQDDSGQWTYAFFAPIAAFANAKAQGPHVSPYAAIGEQAELTFGVRDVFGNALPVGSGGAEGRTIAFDYQYTDRLVSPATWPGAAITFDFEAASKGAVQIEVSADTDALDAARKAGPSAGVLMQSVVDQLGGPGAEVAVATSLDPAAGTYVLGSAQARYADGSPTVEAFAAKVLEYLTAQSPSGPIAPVKIVLTPPTVLATQDPTPVSASLIVRRTREVSAACAAAVPEVAQVSTAARAGRQASDPSGLEKDFCAAFGGYVLALAPGLGASGTLYAVSTKLLGISAQTPSDPLYFAPLPVSNALVSGSVEVPAFAAALTPPLGPISSVAFLDADLDAGMAELFSALDEILSPGAAAAGAKAAPAAFAALVAARAALATEYTKNQLTWLFAQQTPVAPPPPAEAANRAYAWTSFSDQLDASLAAAYQIQTVLQWGLTWQASDAGEGLGSTVDLYGSVQPSDGAQASFDQSPAKVRLQSGKGAPTGRLSATSTLSVSAAASDPWIELPLSYTITHLVLGDPGSAGQASDRGSWLRLLAPVEVKIGETKIPTPRRQPPVPPTLVSQAWLPKVAFTDDGGDTPSLGDLETWSYAWHVSFQRVPQDTITTIASYGQTKSDISVDQAGLRAADDPLPALDLPSAIQLFHMGYENVASLLPGASKSGGQDPGPALEYLAYLVGKVLANTTWETSGHLTGGASSTPPSDEYEVAFLDGENAGTTATVEVSSTDAAAIAALTLTPCDAQGQPLPDIHRQPYTPGDTKKVLTYTSPTGRQWADFLLEIDGLQVTQHPSAWASVQTVRNADLLTHLTTNEGFVLRSAPTQAARRMVPSLAYPGLPVSVPAATGLSHGTLAAYLTALLRELFATGPASATWMLRLGAGLELTLAEVAGAASGTQSIATVQPIVLTSTLEVLPGAGPANPPVVTSDDLAAAIAGRVADALRSAPFDAENAAIVFSLWLFADEEEDHAMLLQLGRMRLPLTNVTPS